MKKVALIGISTPAAIETLRVLTMHPMLEIAGVSDDALAGKRLSEVLPGFNVSNNQPILETEALLEAESDLTIAEDASELILNDTRVIDLSGKQGDLAGMTYRHEAEISSSNSIRLPSPTEQGLNTLLVPIARQGLLNGPVQATSTAQFESAGVGMNAVEILKSDDSIQASCYLSGAESDFPFEISLVKQHAQVGRGLLLTAFVPLSERLTLSTLDNLYREYYDPALFVTQMNSPVEASAVIGSNRAHFFLRASGNMLAATLVLDVLGRGSSMQAVECANLMLGLPEEAGLLFPGHAGL